MADVTPILIAGGALVAVKVASESSDSPDGDGGGGGGGGGTQTLAERLVAGVATTGRVKTEPGSGGVTYPEIDFFGQSDTETAIDSSAERRIAAVYAQLPVSARREGAERVSRAYPASAGLHLSGDETFEAASRQIQAASATMPMDGSQIWVPTSIAGVPTKQDNKDASRSAAGVISAGYLLTPFGEFRDKRLRDKIKEGLQWLGDKIVDAFVKAAEEEFSDDGATEDAIYGDPSDLE